MPFNLLLLPLMAGFVLIARTHLFSYATSSFTSKDTLLLYASIAGLLLLCASRALCAALLATTWGLDFALWLHGVAPFQYIGTTLGTLVLAGGFVYFVNWVVPADVAGLWLYHRDKFNAFERLLLRSAIGVEPTPEKGLARFFCERLFWRAVRLTRFVLLKLFRLRVKWSATEPSLPVGAPSPVMVTMQDNKVYVGLVKTLPPVHASAMEYVSILPLWSGYRGDDRTVTVTTSYRKVLEEHVAKGDEPDDSFVKVLRFKDIGTISLFVENAFQIPGEGGEQKIIAPPPKKSGKHR